MLGKQLGVYNIMKLTQKDIADIHAILSDDSVRDVLRKIAAFNRIMEVAKESNLNGYSVGHQSIIEAQDMGIQRLEIEDE